MRRPSCSCATERAVVTALLLAPLLLATLLLATLLLVDGAHAATVLSKRVEVSIAADDRVTTKTALRVRLDTDADFDAWSPYGIVLDEHIELESLEGGVEVPGGAVQKISRKDLDTGSASPDWVTHGSTEVRSVRFPTARAGSVLWLDYTTLTRPYFPSLEIDLGSRATIERLEVRVRSAATSPLRWAVAAGEGAVPPLAPQPGPDGRQLDLVTRWERPKDEPFSPSDQPFHPRLVIAWGAEESWAAVGGWWDGIMRGLPRDATAVRQRATELAPATLAPRERLSRLLAFARTDVRYVAVEVGVGGYRASAPEETLTRRWGDCKAKAVLLIDLLRAAGLDGFPVLISADADGRIETRVPNPGEFNHMIVAVPAAGVALPGDPVADGLLFVDPTHPRARADWLHAGVQDQDSLVLTSGGARLVRTPIVADKERERLEAVMTLAADGSARGEVALEFQGDLAASFLELAASGEPVALERSVRASLERRLPGMTLEQMSFAEDKVSLVPKVVLRAKADASVFASLTETSALLSFAGSERTPPSSILDGRTIPVVARPGVSERVFVLELPATWALPEVEETAEQTEIGSFRHRVVLVPGPPRPAGQEGRPSVVVERRTEIGRRWIEPAAFGELRKLSLAEHRASRRRLRLAITAATPIP